MRVNFISDNELFDIIGENVSYYRRLYSLEKGKMTQERLAEIIGVSTSVIGGLESKKTNQGISVPTLYRISVALEVSFDKLINKRKKWFILQITFILIFSYFSHIFVSFYRCPKQI